MHTMKEERDDVSIVAQPLASEKLRKKLLKLVHKCAKAKQMRRGVREVGKAMRKGEKGLCVLAGDISPIDVISHIPVYCEDNDIPYVFIPSKKDLGAAAGTKRPTSVVLVRNIEDSRYAKRFNLCVGEVKSIMPVF